MGDLSKWTLCAQPKAIENKDWKKYFNFVEVSTKEALLKLYDEYMAAGCPELAMDTETTSLDRKTLEIVGYSVCWDKKTGYYVPLGHILGSNLDRVFAMDILHKMMLSSKFVLCFNASFDLFVMLKYGYDINPYNLLDLQSVVWNLDTSITMPSLKDSALYYLGIKMMHLDELLDKLSLTAFTLTGDSEKCYNIGLYPCTQDTVFYAGSDAICTYLLYYRFKDFIIDCFFICKLDSEFEKLKIYITESKIPVDVDSAKQLYSKLEGDLKVIENNIYSLAGNIFNVKSDDILKVVFDKLGIEIPPNRDGKISVGEEVLSTISDKHPIINEVLRFRKIAKTLSTYLDKFAQLPDNYCRFDYKCQINPTGRLQGSGTDKTNHFIKMNVQNIPKPKSATYLPHKLQDKNSGILGWDFELVPESIPNKTCTGFKPGNLRALITPGDARLWLSIDYSGQEVVIAANMSWDLAFIEPLLAGLDIHKDVALKMFGADNYDKSKRSVAKACNFGCLYLGNEYALKNQLSHLEIPELKKYYEMWKDVHFSYFEYLERQFKKAASCGYITTPLGRRRYVRRLLKSDNFSDVIKGRRIVANSPVQGCGGDIIKYILLQVYNKILHNESVDYKNKVSFMTTVHDEINFSVTNDFDEFYKISNALVTIMEDLPFYDEPFKWPVRLKTGVSIGRSWGEQFPFQINLKNQAWEPVLDT